MAKNPNPGDEAAERIVRELIKEMFRQKSTEELKKHRDTLIRFVDCIDAVVEERRKSKN
jgi:hypothetical protein